MTGFRLLWVVEPVGYNQYGIEGVFDSLEAAKASRPDLEWREEGSPGRWVSVGADPVAERGSAIYPIEVRTLDSVRARKKG